MAEKIGPSREHGGGDHDETFRPGTKLLNPRQEARLLLMRSRSEVEKLRVQQKTGKKPR